MRHTDASILIASGANVKYAQEQLGHTNASMTLDTYAVLWEQAERAKASSAGPTRAWITLCDVR